MKQIKLEVGKTYRNRSGYEVKIIENDGAPESPYKGSNGEWFSESGRWQYFGKHPEDLIEEVEEVTKASHTLKIPDGVKEITLDYFGNRIVVEMVPEEVEPQPGDVMIDAKGNVYIFKSVVDGDIHKHFAWFGKDWRLVIGSMCISGRPATPEEAQPLFDALKKAGKRWNPETMEVEDVAEIDRIREWVWANLKSALYDKGNVAEAIEAYLKHKEGEK